ncbi:hypothetical protein VNO77_42024 [Canavalia gladiata]|uniref:DUF4283 domain-containing protein n=1 Tax=Canavalia gladiata TaxID=3824 RepID=A0AAN9PSC4_CANGL
MEQEVAEPIDRDGKWYEEDLEQEMGRNSLNNALTSLPWFITGDKGVRKVSVWIRIPDLAMELFNLRFLWRVGSKITKLFQEDLCAWKLESNDLYTITSSLQVFVNQRNLKLKPLIESIWKCPKSYRIRFLHLKIALDGLMTNKVPRTRKLTIDAKCEGYFE